MWKRQSANFSTPQHEDSETIESAGTLLVAGWDATDLESAAGDVQDQEIFDHSDANGGWATRSFLYG